MESSTLFHSSDLIYCQKRGIPFTAVQEQHAQFCAGFRPIQLVRSATIGDGILTLLSTTEHSLLNEYKKAVTIGRMSKFVPASGAASRMFHSLSKLLNTLTSSSQSGSLQVACEEPEELKLAELFFDQLGRLAISVELERVISADGSFLKQLLETKQYGQLLSYLITDKGLNYSNMPKGMIPFHSTKDGVRTPFDEQLAEALATVADENGMARVHFTLPESGREQLESHIWARSLLLADQGKQFALSFSVQSIATDTIAVDENNTPIRGSNGQLVFRPAGHGALLSNLVGFKGDIIFLKNIDNVQPESKRKDTIRYKQLLAGLLVSVQSELFNHIHTLQTNSTPEQVEACYQFARQRLNLHFQAGFDTLDADAKRLVLLDRLNRPIRICGMVKNQGEPGGGPFWIREEIGCETLQIVEKAQINLSDPEQISIWNSSTHFNPVDIVCGVRDYAGQPFDLQKFVNHDSGLIAVKSIGGKTVKALELPGLWNGSMAGWITLFVEVPITTFTPVKTIYDLLRPEHQDEEYKED